MKTVFISLNTAHVTGTKVLPADSNVSPAATPVRPIIMGRTGALKSSSRRLIALSIESASSSGKPNTATASMILAGSARRRESIMTMASGEIIAAAISASPAEIAVMNSGIREEGSFTGIPVSRAARNSGVIKPPCRTAWTPSG